MFETATAQAPAAPVAPIAPSGTGAAFSLVDVLRNVQNPKNGPAGVPTSTDHPTRSAWIPPAQREFTRLETMVDAIAAVDAVVAVDASVGFPQDDIAVVAKGDDLRRQGFELLRELSRAS